MNRADVLILYDYNYWANGRILAAAARVSAEQFAAPGTFPYGGLRGTLVHALDAEQSWCLFFQQLSWEGVPELKEADLPTLDLLVARWRQAETAMRSYLAGLSDDDLNGHLRYTVENGQQRDRLLWHCLVHVVNHGTQHRAEAAALLTSFDSSPGDLDFTLFLNQYKPAD
jgi:uncharacterized damage-inducible protein DinB